MADVEMLSVLDAEGRKVGLKPRVQVHRDGDWHMLAFVWSARQTPDGRHRFLLQVRGRPEDRFAGHVDAPAGGHVLDHEDHLESAVRECEEEVGLSVRKTELMHLGKRRVESLAMDCKRTFQHHYLCRRPLRLADTRLTEEVTGFLEVDLDEFAALVSASLPSVMAEVISRANPVIHAATITAEVLALYSREVRRTFGLILEAARHALTTGRANGSLLP